MRRSPHQQQRVADGVSVALAAGLLCVLMGTAVVAIRATGIDVSNVVPRITSGALFVLAGGALLGASRRVDALRQAFGVGVLIVAAACLVDRIASGHMSAANDGGAISPLPTVIAFLLMGTGLAAYGARRVWIGYLAVAAAGVIVITGFSGFALGLRPDNSVIAGMSPTSLVFLAVLVTGTLSLWPHLPPYAWVTQQTVGARLARQLVPVMIGCPLVIGLAVPHWDDWTGLPLTAGVAVAVALLITVLIAVTGLSVRIIDRAEEHNTRLRQLAEDAIRESERQFRTLALEMPVGVIQRDEHGEVEFANDEALRILGLPAGSPPDAIVPDLIDPDDRSAALDGMRATIASGESHELDLRVSHATTGEQRWVHLRGSRQDDVDGNFASYVVTLVDVTERRDYERRLQHLAHHDSLTGLLNRRAFEARMDEHVARVGRYGATGTLLMLDLDGFKAVNDTLGHAAGDALLVGIAGVLADRLRTTDVIARLGGDEFAVILPEQSAAQASDVANALLTLVRECATTLDPSHRRRVSTSVGLAAFEQGISAEEMLHRADTAMYAAKQSGKDRVVDHGAPVSNG